MDQEELQTILLEISKLTISTTLASSGRTLMTKFLSKWDREAADARNNADLCAISEKGIALMSESSAEDLAGALRDRLGRLYERQGKWSLAVKTLSESSFDSGTIQQQLALAPPTSELANLDAEKYKLELNLRIAHALLKSNDFTNAESYLNRAALLFSSTSSRGSSVMSLPLVADSDSRRCGSENPESATMYQLKLFYAQNQAMICDLKQQYTKAAALYYELCCVEGHEKYRYFLKSGVCGVLSSPSPQQARFLSKWCGDTRFGEFQQSEECAAVQVVARKVLQSRLVSKQDANAVLKCLEPHQRDQIADETSNVTIFKRAINEHNVMAISKLYSSITFRRLAELLDSSVLEAELVMRQIIESKQLVAQMDQVAGLVLFETQDAKTAYEKVRKQIPIICGQIETIAELIV